MAIPYEFLLGLKEGAPRAILCDVDHPDGELNIWSGLGTLEYAGKEYVGAGVLGSITTSPKSTELRIDEVTLSLAGVDPTVLEDLSDEVRGRIASTYLAVLTPDMKVRAAMLIDEINLDYLSDGISADGTATISVTGETGFWQLRRVTDEVWSPSNQKLKYPTDVGLDFIPTLRNKETVWTVD